jgi:hypothetical protein
MLDWLVRLWRRVDSWMHGRAKGQSIAKAQSSAAGPTYFRSNLRGRR